MRTKLVQETLDNYATSDTSSKFMEHTRDHPEISCIDCKWYSHYGCLNSNSVKYGDDVTGYDLCVEWEADDDQS